MGGATSRFAETDWESASAGVKETIDGSMPSEDLSILTLRKNNSIVDQRSFEIRNDVDELLYVSKPIVGSTKWFDLCSASGEKLFCVHTDALHEKWTIFAYKPVWEDQQADEGISDKEKIYRRARIDIAYGKSHGEVFPYIQDWEHDSDFKGVASDKSLLKVEEIKSMTAQFQSYIPQAALHDNALVHPALCGWWVWENTRNRHQMKMHLVKDSDIALHCIVAITTNLVHVEKESFETTAQVLGQ
ncbi:unnamed protein product [Cylindrotheca closterium]|uniref:Uncharacterized protein n=1 Tax=Cylindrotheca closterium TaxID=2856 RepID=A0AAD2PWY4_9STRA|nr:unnamed protein product [Cylindrotheca closterium]